MFRWLENILQAPHESANALLECHFSCRSLFSSYISHYPAIASSFITATAVAYTGCPYIVLGTRGGFVHILSLNSGQTIASLSPLAEPGTLAPAPVVDIVHVRGDVLVARGSTVTIYSISVMRERHIPVGLPITSISAIATDPNNILLGFAGGTFGWIDLRTRMLRMQAISWFGVLTSHTYHIGRDIPTEQPEYNVEVCAKRNPDAPMQFFTSMTKPDIPVRIWDMRSTSSVNRINVSEVGNGQALWGDFGVTHLAIVSSSDAVLLYNYQEIEKLEYFSSITTRSRARCVWIDEHRLISGTYSRMREEDQRGFPIIAVPPQHEENIDINTNIKAKELPYEWINCPFQQGTSAFYPFSSKFVPTINTFYGIAMENSICVLDERPHDQISRIPGTDSNHYESGFMYYADKPLGIHPSKVVPEDEHPYESRSYACYSKIANTVDSVLQRWETSISVANRSRNAAALNVLNLLLCCSSTTPQPCSLSSSLSQSMGRKYKFEEYAYYSNTSPRCASQLFPERGSMSMSPLLNIDLPGLKSSPTWWMVRSSNNQRDDLCEVDSPVDQEARPGSQGGCSEDNQEFSFDAS